MTPDVFTSLYPENIKTGIESLITESSKLKTKIFMSIMQNTDIDKKVLQSYLINVSTFLKAWSGYADQLVENMKATKAVAGPYAIKYADIKDYIYASYDYASVLPFADGVFTGIRSGKFENEDDIKEFFNYTISKAFKDRAETVAGLLDESFTFTDNMGVRPVPATTAEAELFNSVKEQKLFNHDDTNELYKAVEKAAEFMMYDLNKNYSFRNSDTKILIAMISNVVEYMTYSIAAYATRIYIISRYACPYIFYSKNQYATESAGFDTEGSLLSTIEVTVMRDTDEMIFRDIMKNKDAYRVLCNFLKEIGAPTSLFETTDHFRWYSDLKKMETNKFYSQLLGNALREYIVGQMHNEVSYRMNARNIENAKETLQKYVYNSTQAIQNSSTPKQEILHVIRGTEPSNKTVEGYQELAYNLMMFGMMMLCNIESSFSYLNEHRKDEMNNPAFKNTVLNTSSEVARALSDLYKEIAIAVLLKARDIEMSINTIRNNKVSHVMADLKIKVPGIDQPDNNLNDNMMGGVPDTTRMPVDLINLYSIPTMESLEMYDEYVRSLPGMDGDPYYEAVNISQIINAIMSFIEGLKNKWDQFFNNKQFKSAVNWAQTHKADMQGMMFTPPMEVLPYKADLTISQIDPLIQGLKSFTENDVKDEESSKKFINSLYGSDQKLLSLFGPDATDGDSKEKATLYQNWILFGLDPTNRASLNVTPKKLDSSDAIKKELDIWFGNVADSQGTHDGLVQKTNELKEAFKSFKEKIVKLQSSSNSTAQQNSEEKAPDMPSGGSDDQTQTTTTQTQTSGGSQNDNAMNSTDITQITLTQAQAVMNKLWGNLYQVITKAIKDQYKYIQEAYSKGRKA